MKNVLLIGDSIRMGYDKAVRKTLEGTAQVYFPEENCRFAAYVLRYVHDYKSLVPDGKVDVVHWNTGLWDVLRMYGEEPQTPIEMYGYYIDRICVRIKKLFPEAKVIFATSTSVDTEKMTGTFMRYNRDIEAYNAVAVRIAESHGFAVNDLYAVSKTLPEEAHSDPVHFYTDMATKVFADQVLSCIAPALGMETVPEYQKEPETE